MSSTSIFHRQLRQLARSSLTSTCGRRLLATQNVPKKELKHAETPTEAPVASSSRKTTWLSRKVETSPAVRWWFNQVTTLLGYNSPKQLAGRRTFFLYENVCASAPDVDRAFWQEECELPPTFQSWFTVTNLHIWMLTVRLRALPPAHGKIYVQFLVDHFFLDIEDRVRAILQPPRFGPPRDPYTFITPFYVNPNTPVVLPDGGEQPRGHARESVVMRQMNIFKEQWQGMGLAFDLGLVKDDAEMAGAVWRNLLGARGARGIAFPDPSSPSSSASHFRRSVNLGGGVVEKGDKIDLEKEEARDDGSGVHDFAPEDADKYLKYPELMLDVVTYVRRELARLDRISDEDLMEGDLSVLSFGSVRGQPAQPIPQTPAAVQQNTKTPTKRNK